MTRVMHEIDEVIEKIKSGESLFLAGDEKVLKSLPRGNWIAGTIPYFMSDQGGLLSQERIHVTQLPEYVSDVAIQQYDNSSLAGVYDDIPDNGVGLIVIPGLSDVHFDFALMSPSYSGFGTKPLVGWISGVHLEDIGKTTPKVFNGGNGGGLESEAVVMHLALPDNKVADVNIINIFTQGGGDTIVFPEDGFAAKEARVNGELVNFAEYVAANQTDTKLPLVADYEGAQVNISFQSVDEKEKVVHFYAPVFSGMEYKHASPVSSYIEEFTSRLPKEGMESTVFSCNCILNYLYSELEGKKTGPMTGPITFGEVAYQLLNQTLVYLSINDA